MVSLDRFVEGLCRIPEREFTLPGVARYIQDSPLEPASLGRYLFYQPTHYTRNLVYKCDLFEVIAVCWDLGQGSPIHNHQGQNCWMAVPIGRLGVQNYELLASDDGGYCELRASGRFEMDPAHPSFVNREEPIHAVFNAPAPGERATSLHVYSRPYDRCLVYSLEKKSCSEVPLFYDSEYGRPTSPTLGAVSDPHPGPAVPR